MKFFFLEKKEKVSQSTRTSDEFWCYNKIAFGLAIGKNVHLIRHCENLRSFPTLKKIYTAVLERPKTTFK